MPIPNEMVQPRFYLARRSTRWDVYPQAEPERVIALDFHGFWTKEPNGAFRFNRVTQFELIREITREEAEQ